MSGIDTGRPDGRRHVLVIDDEAQIHRFLRPALEAAGYAVASAATAAEGLREAVQHPPDMVLLDLGLPDMDGKQALGRLRAFSQVPVIILSARDRETEKIAALDGGADDYVEKPFSLGELLARIRTALRRRDGLAPPPGADGMLEAGPLALDIPAHRLLLAGEPVTLSPREFQLLAMLMRHAGRLVTHRQLLTTVWGPAHADDVQYLRVYIGHLRQKLGAAARMITTEPGIGYRLVAEPG
ncbi:response regulator [Lichenicoccus roseus]|uniref:Response regulator transcription factor n=1 Tax=Lichenicoccus roseus TaxID=2683649 RepID=A0A5R9JAY2_9PROT|nr:response regulator transcription factor [Lichenicoccus roseus]TLU73963.1 response regulator transcription factor [Lichenicoccus roseus]